MACTQAGSLSLSNTQAGSYVTSVANLASWPPYVGPAGPGCRWRRRERCRASVSLLVCVRSTWVMFWRDMGHVLLTPCKRSTPACPHALRRHRLEVVLSAMAGIGASPLQRPRATALRLARDGPPAAPPGPARRWLARAGCQPGNQRARHLGSAAAQAGGPDGRPAEQAPGAQESSVAVKLLALTPALLAASALLDGGAARAAARSSAAVAPVCCACWRQQPLLSLVCRVCLLTGPPGLSCRLGPR
jgi:hypothetical protein